MKRAILIGFLALLPIIGFAHPRQDRLQPPLKSADEVSAWLDDPDRPKVRLHPLPPIAAPTEPLLTADDQERISGLIAQLAQIKDPDYGISPTMSGSSFAPVSGSERAGSMILTDHHLKPFQAVLELVKLGPRALPLLLKHLDDSTPTQLVMKINRFMGVLSFGHEMDINEANPNEQHLKPLARDLSDRHSQPRGTDYAVKIGDVCFTIIGQIVGRQYLAVRYQPTAIVIINSPVVDAKLAEQVRAVWTSDTPTQHLFQSLLTDYSCRSVYNGWSLDGWYHGNDLQCDAAMRLLYYFPRETVAMIAQRLHNLKVEATSTEAEWEQRELPSGVRAQDFVKAVSWCPDRRIRTEMAAIVKRTGDRYVMTEAVRGIARSQRKSLAPLIQAMLGNEGSSGQIMHVYASDLLEAVARYWQADARPIFIQYMQPNDPVRLNTVCRALCNAKTRWDVAVLRPLLSDQRTIPGAAYWKGVPGARPEIPARVCDAAADALATWHPELKFDFHQLDPDLDQQIAVIKARLAR